MGMPFDWEGQRTLMKKSLEYLKIIEEPGMLIEPGMGNSEAECEICMADRASIPGNIELNLR